VKIFQLESTNYCNGFCGYCPTGKGTMTRKQGFVSMDVVERVCDIYEPCHQDVFPFNEIHAERTLELHHFGEPLLHPGIIRIVRYVRDRGIKPILGTNGLLLSKTMILKLRDAGLDSFHIQWNRFSPLDEILDAAARGGVVVIVLDRTEIADYTIERIKAGGGKVYLKRRRNFGGFEDYEPGKEGDENCVWLKEDWKNVLWDGTVVTCCNDYDGVSNRGSILLPDGVQKNEPFHYCEGCAGYSADRDSEGVYL
jgi:hypothetical protein